MPPVPQRSLLQWYQPRFSLRMSASGLDAVIRVFDSDVPFVGFADTPAVLVAGRTRKSRLRAIRRPFPWSFVPPTQPGLALPVSATPAKAPRSLRAAPTRPSAQRPSPSVPRSHPARGDLPLVQPYGARRPLVSGADLAGRGLPLPRRDQLSPRGPPRIMRGRRSPRPPPQGTCGPPRGRCRGQGRGPAGGPP